MTLTQSLTLAITKLKANKMTDLPQLEAEILLSKILKKPCEFLLTHGELKLSAKQTASYELLLTKRLKGEPIAYLTGHKEFYGLDFKVNKNVLIPRPETELMIEEALKLVTLPVRQAGRSTQPVTLIDVGTGSGCIIIALAKQIKNFELRITNYKFFATDISAKALIIAKQNAKLNGVEKNIKFLRGNLLEPLEKILDFPRILRGGGDNSKKKFVVGNLSLVILANLPYLTPAQIKNSPSIKHEPKLALSAGSDGLKYYRQLFKQIKTLHLACYALCEIDPRQTAKIKQLIKNELPQTSYQIKKDLSGLNRLVIIKLSSLAW